MRRLTARGRALVKPRIASNNFETHARPQSRKTSGKSQTQGQRRPSVPRRPLAHRARRVRHRTDQEGHLHRRVHRSAADQQAVRRDSRTTAICSRSTRAGPSTARRARTSRATSIIRAARTPIRSSATGASASRRSRTSRRATRSPTTTARTTSTPTSSRTAASATNAARSGARSAPRCAPPMRAGEAAERKARRAPAPA